MCNGYFWNVPIVDFVQQITLLHVYLFFIPVIFFEFFIEADDPHWVPATFIALLWPFAIPAKIIAWSCLILPHYVSGEKYERNNLME